MSTCRMNISFVEDRSEIKMVKMFHEKPKYGVSKLQSLYLTSKANRAGLPHQIAKYAIAKLEFLVRKWFQCEKAHKALKDSPAWRDMQLLVELPGDPPFSSFPLRNILRYHIPTDSKNHLKLCLTKFVSLSLSLPILDYLQAGS